MEAEEMMINGDLPDYEDDYESYSSEIVKAAPKNPYKKPAAAV
jgi:hypothetical protein